MHILGKTIEPAFSIHIQEPLRAGMLQPVIEECNVFLKADNITGVGTAVKYYPYGVQIENMALFRIPDEQQITRETLEALLKKHGFHPIYQG